MPLHLDTSVLIDALTGPRRSLNRLEQTVAAGHVIGMSTLVLYEWRRGRRTDDELTWQEALMPSAHARVFGEVEAVAAAEMYRSLERGARAGHGHRHCRLRCRPWCQAVDAQSGRLSRSAGGRAVQPLKNVRRKPLRPGRIWT
jgi:predicted nucleic acid-binding protein